MDEPTIHLDSQRQKELVEAMKSFKKESHTIPQLMIIIHHRELEELADTLYKVHIKEGVSKGEELTYTYNSKFKKKIKRFLGKLIILYKINLNW